MIHNKQKTWLKFPNLFYNYITKAGPVLRMLELIQ